MEDGGVLPNTSSSPNANGLIFGGSSNPGGTRVRTHQNLYRRDILQ
jgi:hypothetical protein